MGVITWSWWIVFSPTILTISLLIIFIIGFFGLAILQAYLETNKRRY